MKKSILCSLMLFSTAVCANSATLQQQLEKMGVTNIQITDSVLPGFKTVMADQGLLHISEDGRYFVQGEIFELKEGKAINITHQALLKELNSLEKEMIVFPAKNQKHVITVFMDITCHYCNLLHQKMADYNALGITVRYLAFPRAGLNSQTARQMEAIWTSPDPVFTLNESEKGKLPAEQKTPNIVKKQYQLGIKFGVKGTPSIITQTGEVIPGFVEPKELLKILNESN